MYLSIWLIATIIYVFAVAATLFGIKSEGGYDFGTPFIILLLLCVETIAYLIFWIVYLAVK